ncbi:MAG: hypothetical protein U0931_32965 [Vulcanimicrobiota bacterium]
MRVQNLPPVTPKLLQKLPQDPKPPEDPKDQSSLGQAVLTVGRHGLNGALEGVGYAYLGYLGDCFGPMAGAGVRIGLAGLGAAVGVKEYGPRLEGELGSGMGKLMGGVVGAGKVLMMTGLSPAHTLGGAMLGGALTGGLFGVLETPRQ